MGTLKPVSKRRRSAIVRAAGMSALSRHQWSLILRIFAAQNAHPMA